MKKVLLFGLLAGMFAFNAMGQNEPDCYDGMDKAAPDFYLDHPYYAVCTDWEGTGSKLFAPDNNYVDFNGGSTVDFTDIYVSVDGYYLMTVWYGVGYADETGATMEVNVNDAPWDILTMHKLAGDPPATQTLELELYGEGFSNTIQFKQVKDWPTLSRIQLELVEAIGGSSTPSVKTDLYTIVSADNAIAINGLPTDSEVHIYSITGALIENAVATADWRSNTLAEGLYVVNVNGEAHKILVK